MAPYKKGFEEWKEELVEGIEDGIWKFTDSVAGFIDSLSDKTIHALEELDRKSEEKNLAAKNDDTGTVLHGFLEILKKGDVIFARRMVYRHYGIYAGRKKVIHYAKKEINVRPKTAIEETSIAEFSKGDPVYVIKFSKKADFLYSPGKTLKRAKSRIGMTDYNLVFNNCEHFAYWCKTGKHESSQVKDVCEQLFNKRFELDELKEEIADKVWGSVCDILDSLSDKLNDLFELLPGKGLKLH
jgi:hypothetical protein